MKSDEIRAMQAPFKEQYKAAPDAAVITLTADGTLGDEGVTCSVETGRAIVEAGLHPATGGDGMSACSGDMLLQALAACAGVTLRAVATALDIPVAGG
ncbi:MAG: OsmC family peroxiredoxin, partial [Alphaproteobacteria bacterium]